MLPAPLRPHCSAGQRHWHTSTASIVPLAAAVRRKKPPPSSSWRNAATSQYARAAMRFRRRATAPAVIGVGRIALHRGAANSRFGDSAKARASENIFRNSRFGESDLRPLPCDRPLTCGQRGPGPLQCALALGLARPWAGVFTPGRVYHDGSELLLSDSKRVIGRSVASRRSRWPGEPPVGPARDSGSPGQERRLRRESAAGVSEGSMSRI